MTLIAKIRKVYTVQGKIEGRRGTDAEFPGWRIFVGGKMYKITLQESG